MVARCAFWPRALPANRSTSRSRNHEPLIGNHPMAYAHLTSHQWDHPISATFNFARDVSIFALTSINPPAQPQPASLPRGDGRKVIVMPGMLAADFTTNRLVGWLKLL